MKVENLYMLIGVVGPKFDGEFCRRYGFPPGVRKGRIQYSRNNGRENPEWPRSGSAALTGLCAGEIPGTQ
jgi:hypothetical protein